jgi:hypothetical protein
MVYVLVVESLERCRKTGFAGGKIDAGDSIIHPVSQHFAGLESGIVKCPAKVIGGLNTRVLLLTE